MMALVSLAASSACRGDDAVADPKTYLADVVALLDKPWPGNRLVNIVAHGHSVPAGYFRTPVVDTFNAYPHLLHKGVKSRHPHAVTNVVVTAIGGENSISGATRFERDVLALRPDVVLIDYSLNDRGVGLEKARAAWTEMIEKATAAGVKVLLCTPTADQSSRLDDPNDPLNQHAAQVRELAAKHHVGLIDSLAAFHAHVKNGGKLVELMSQGNHPNRQGHDLVVAEALKWFPTPATPLTKTTHVFRTVGDVKVEADVYRPAGNALRPVVVWIHGGALIVGSRVQVPRNLLDLCAQERFILVSLDYRLAPEVKLPEIAADIQDAFRWLHAEGPKLFHADTSRVVVAGGSAGGFLTMLVGTSIKPRPNALVTYWGYGDIDALWATDSSEHYRTKTPLVDPEEARAAVNKGVLTGTPDPETQKARGNFYRHLRQAGGWSREVTGIDAPKEPGKLDPWCPVKNITSEYPPILMIHGTADTDVPYASSADMARELKKAGVPHELITIPDAEHGLRDGDPKLVADAHAKALEFIRRQLTK